MKKLLALLLAALVLLSMPLGWVRAEESDPPAEGSSDHPRPSKSLRQWEKDRESIQLTGDIREDVLLIAQSQLGYSADATYYEEKTPGKKRYYTRYGDWYGTKFCDWCDVFVSFCLYYAGCEDYPLESSCTRHMMKLKAAGYWREWNSYVPQKGDLVFFVGKRGTNKITHVGLVEEVIPPEEDKAGRLVTIEGNQRNPNGRMACVRRMTRELDTVVGYGTFEKGNTYPEDYSLRPYNYTIIDESSPYFVEYPTLEAMRFLGMTHCKYFDYWFPEPLVEEEPVVEEPPAAEESETEAADPEAADPEAADPEAEPRGQGSGEPLSEPQPGDEGDEPLREGSSKSGPGSETRSLN